MNEQDDILDEFRKRDKPDVPKDFFETFSDELMAKVVEHDSGIDTVKKTARPDVPENFFESFADNILLKTSADPSANQVKPTKVIRLRIAGIIGTAAACLLVLFLVNKKDKEQKIAENDAIHSNTPPIVYSADELLAYVDETDIIDYMVEENIDFSEDEVPETATKADTDQKSHDELDDLNKADILYYLEDDLNDIYIEDLEL